MTVSMKADRRHAWLVATDDDLAGAPILARNDGRAGERVTTVLDRIGDNQDIEEIARGLDVDPGAIELLVRLEADLHERRVALEGRAKPKPRKSTRPLLRLDPAIVAEGKRRRIIHSTCAALAQSGDVHSASVSSIIRGAEIARKTFYDIFNGTAEAILHSFEWAAFEAIAAGRDGGVESLIAWAEAHPEAVRTILLAGPQIDLVRYNGLADDGARLIGDGPLPVAALSGALTVAATRARAGEPVDAALIGELVSFGERFAFPEMVGGGGA